MAKVVVEATETVQRTHTVEINVAISDVKRWISDNYDRGHGLEWEDVILEFVQDTVEVDWSAAEIEESGEELFIDHAEVVDD